MIGQGERTPLNLDDLSDFEPKPPKRKEEQIADKKAVDKAATFPSREASAEGQLNIQGPKHILDRFKSVCKADRRPYYDMLEILMDSFEEKS